MFYIWLIIVVGLAIIEMLSLSLVSIWFVISGIISMITSLFTDNVKVQISIFVLLGLFLMLITRKLVKKIIPLSAKTNIDRIIGMEGIVTKKITKREPGEVKVDGKIWTALANKNIDENSLVRIIEINSTKLTVEEVEE